MLILGALWGTPLGCTPAPEDRSAWLVDQLILDNLRWQSRDTALLEAKYTRMAADRYDFMRAMATVDLADWTRPDGDRLPTEFQSIRGTEAVLLAGDPHPENIGVHKPAGDVLVIEVNDLDGATFGPYLWDVRRGMAGLGVLLAEAGCEQACRDGMFRAYATGYAETIADGAVGVRSGYGPTSDAPAVVADLLSKARVDGAERAVFTEETRDAGDGRFFAIDDGLDPSGRGDLRPSPDEAEQLERLIRALGLDVRDAVRRFGQGVASLPAVRFAVLVDGGEEGDDHLVQLREVIDPLPMPGWRADLDGAFQDNAQRIVATSHLLWSRPDADPALAGVMDGAMAFKATTFSGYHEGFEHRRILRRVADGRFGEPELLAWSSWLGEHLASVHARAPTREGDEALPAIQTDLDGRIALFVEERVADAERSTASLLRDHRLFVAALDRLGPDLGAP